MPSAPVSPLAPYKVETVNIINCDEGIWMGKLYFLFKKKC